jgi:ATP-dependent Clp protease ATP-binding subunit ClpX
MDNVALSFEPEMLDYIVDKAFENKLGARGLRGLMEMVMTDLMFEMPDNKDAYAAHAFTVTKQYAMEKIEKADLHQLQQAL